MIIDVIGSKFSVDCEPSQVNKIIFAKVRDFMEQNEYFHEEHFLELLEEDYAFEVATSLSTADIIITISQLEDWVEDAAAAEDEEEDLDPLTQESAIEDLDDEEDPYDDDGDDNE